jgi:FkbH-like protein
MSGTQKIKVALTGDVALELLAPYFRKAGYEVYVPAGFGAWRQEVLDENSGLNRFRPDFVYDVTAGSEVLAAETEGFYDGRMQELASMPYSLSGIEAIVEEFEFVRLASPKKILALDADNTLWKGILSEDGAEALEPYSEFQRGVKALAADGVVVVLLTKNDPFEFRGDMPLGNGDFAAVRMNWAPKAGNLLDICRELSLAPDSAVFVDDNPHERAQMAAHLPEVTVVPFPADMSRPAQFLRRLKGYFFADAGKTAEDGLRAGDYAANRVRENLRLRYADAGEYLDSLGLYAAAGTAVEADLDRLAQMAGKTNQFNATTIRRGRDDFAALLADPLRRIYVFRAGDRFGEQGLVCYVVVDLGSGRITDFVMSCRVMGRTLEHFAYDHVCRELGFRPEIDFAPSAKNAPFAGFLKSLADGLSTSYRRKVV